MAIFCCIILAVDSLILPPPYSTLFRCLPVADSQTKPIAGGSEVLYWSRRYEYKKEKEKHIRGSILLDHLDRLHQQRDKHPQRDPSLVICQDFWLSFLGLQSPISRSQLVWYGLINANLAEDANLVAGAIGLPYRCQQ